MKTKNKPALVSDLYFAAMESVRSARSTLKVAYAVAHDADRKELAAALMKLSDEIQEAAFTGFDDDVMTAIDEWQCPTCGAESCKVDHDAQTDDADDMNQHANGPEVSK